MLKVINVKGIRRQHIFVHPASDDFRFDGHIARDCIGAFARISPSDRGHKLAFPAFCPLDQFAIVFRMRYLIFQFGAKQPKNRV